MSKSLVPKGTVVLRWREREIVVGYQLGVDDGNKPRSEFRKVEVSNVSASCVRAKWRFVGCVCLRTRVCSVLLVKASMVTP